MEKLISHIYFIIGEILQPSDQVASMTNLPKFSEIIADIASHT